MRGVWLVARREFAYFVLRRGFLISLLLVPVWIGISVAIPLLAARSVSVASFVVVDQSGQGFAGAIDKALLRSEARTALELMAVYVKAAADVEALKKADPELAKVLLADPIDATHADALVALGGPEKVAERIKPFLPAGTPAPPLPPKRFIRVDVPPNLTDTSPAGLRDFLSAQRERGPDKISAVLIVPASFGMPDAPAQLWSRGLPASGLLSFLRRVATERQQTVVMGAFDIEEEEAREILQLSAKVESFDTAPEANGKPVSLADRIRSIAPLALSGVLFFVVFLSSTMLLGSIIEDKSSRVVEVILSCVTSDALMAGKLLGAAGAALAIVLMWAGGMYSVTLLSNDFGSLLATALDAVVRPDFLPLVLVLFVLAFLIYCSMFLIAASIAKTPQDAQAYVGPMMLVVMLPFFFITALIADQNSTLAQVFTFIPIYTPFVLMMRLGAQPPAFDVIAGTALATVTALSMVWLAAYVYRRNAVPIEGGPSRV